MSVFCFPVVEHWVSSAKGCGFNSQGTHIQIKKCIARMYCKSLWIKASAKCINVNMYISSHMSQYFIHNRTRGHVYHGVASPLLFKTI